VATLICLVTSSSAGLRRRLKQIPPRISSGSLLACRQLAKAVLCEWQHQLGKCVNGLPPLLLRHGGKRRWCHRDLFGDHSTRPGRVGDRRVVGQGLQRQSWRVRIGRLRIGGLLRVARRRLKPVRSGWSGRGHSRRLLRTPAPLI